MKKASVLVNRDDLLCRLNFIRNKKQEYFICLSLGLAGKVLARRTVTIGTLTTALVHPREVFAGPLKDRAAAIVVAHNHPSGMVIPSDDDIKTTHQLVAAAQILGIHFQDHMIVSKDAFFSFRENGYLLS